MAGQDEGWRKLLGYAGRKEKDQTGRRGEGEARLDGLLGMPWAYIRRFQIGHESGGGTQPGGVQFRGSWDDRTDPRGEKEALAVV